MKVNKKPLGFFGIIFLLIVLISVVISLDPNSNQASYQTGEGLTKEQKKSNINDLVKHHKYDEAKTLADNYYYYDNNVDNHHDYLLKIQVCKEKNLTDLDKAEIKKYDKTANNNTSTKKEENSETQKVNDEFKKITDDINAIGMSNLTTEQIVSFINKYMVFWDTNKTKHSELHDSVVENLIKLKHQYSLYNKYYVDSNMKVYKPKIGMTKNEVMAFTKYIAPEDINKTTTKSSISEQYCYSNGDYLYFENGILSTIQE